MGWIGNDIDAIEAGVQRLERRFDEIEKRLDDLTFKVDAILAILQPPLPTGFSVTETRGEKQ